MVSRNKKHAGEVMKAEKINKLKMIKIWEILSQETDEEHPMTTNELLEKLQALGIECNRKTLYADIDALNEFGYEIMCKHSRSNEYYVEDRAFSVAELRILMDAIQAADFITENKSAQFIDKIANLAGTRSGEVLKDHVIAFNNTKTDNEHIYYIVDTINEAIAQQHKIKFLYFDYDTKHNRQYRKDGKFYYVNPYTTLMDNDKYYLIGYDDFQKKIWHYRVDRMEQVSVSRHPMSYFDEIAKFDVRAYKKQLFGMFSGEESEVTFKVSKKLIDVIYDVFGVGTHLMNYDDEYFLFTATVQLSPQFYGWCCSFGNELKIISPARVVNRAKDYVEGLRELYKND